MMSAGTTRRTVRVDDDLWSAATARAKERGDTVSQIVRLALMVYVADEVEVDDARTFWPGTRVEVHELDGGYLVIPTEDQTARRVCESCNGSGSDWPEYPDDPCPNCGGSGEVQ